MDAVHGFALPANGTLPTPIIESRVTSAASASSLIAFGTCRPLGQHEIADFRGLSQTRTSTSSGFSAEFAQHAARIDDGAGTIGADLYETAVTERRPRVTGAQRADDHVVDGRRVLDHHHVLALRPV